MGVCDFDPRTQVCRRCGCCHDEVVAMNFSRVLRGRPNYRCNPNIKHTEAMVRALRRVRP